MLGKYILLFIKLKKIMACRSWRPLLVTLKQWTILNLTPQTTPDFVPLCSFEKKLLQFNKIKTLTRPVT